MHVQSTIRDSIRNRRAAAVLANTGPTEAADSRPDWSVTGIASNTRSNFSVPPEPDVDGATSQRLEEIRGRQFRNYEDLSIERARLRAQVAASSLERSLLQAREGAPPVVRDRDHECPICLETYEDGDLIVGADLTGALTTKKIESQRRAVETSTRHRRDHI